MRPLVRVALIGAVVLALARRAGTDRAPSAVARALPPSPADPVAACPSGQLPDQGVCIPVPLAAPDLAGPNPVSEESVRSDRDEQRLRYEELPLRPERPGDYRRYRLPVNVQGDAPRVTGDAGGVNIAVEGGVPVRLPSLENQLGDVEVVFVGPLVGTTVVTEHQVRESNVTRRYLVLLGRLQQVAPGLKKGARLASEAVLGFAGDGGGPGEVQLHLAIRRVRDGVTPSTLPAPELANPARTIATDPRNLLLLKR